MIRANPYKQMFRSILFLILIILLSCCVRQAAKTDLIAKQNKAWGLGPDGNKTVAAQANYQVMDLGWVDAKLYTYKGSSTLFIMHNANSRFIIKIDTIQEFKNKNPLVKQAIYKRRNTKK